MIPISCKISATTNQELPPKFVTGFTDAEGSFILSISPNSRHSNGYRVKLFFQIGLHSKDKALLEKIQCTLGVGAINKHSSKSISLRVQSFKELEVIINHFNKYPLITQKGSDFQLFKQAYEIIKDQRHLTSEGLNVLVGLKSSMNLGLSDSLKAAFPDVVPTIRPIVTDQRVLDPDWLAGFVSGEGCFFVHVRKSVTHKTGYQVQLRFQITQHIRDEQLIRSIMDYFNCGNVHTKKEDANFIVEKISCILNIIIPFFNKYTILGIKAFDLEDFKRVAELILSGAHLNLKV